VRADIREVELDSLNIHTWSAGGQPPSALRLVSRGRLA
jgi:hypothetical protein